MAQVFPLQNINDVNCKGYSLNCIQIKNGEYLQYQDYTRKSQKVYRRSYGAYCAFLKDTNLPLIEKDNERKRA